jgi:spore coat polysaccharide biosynthesis protein SpsF (cytidylyltransferase family)
VTRVVAILQARMGSARLPGKILAPVAGRPMLEHIVRRAQAAATLDEVVVATSDGDADAPVAELARRLDAPCFRGSEEDVLSRFAGAAQAHAADVVVRLTGDNPLVDPAFIDHVVSSFTTAAPRVAYLDTTTSATWPYGLSVEVVDRAALDRAAAEAPDVADREHVTRWIRQRPQDFPAVHLRADRDDSDLRWTVDLPADLEHVRALYDALDLGEHFLDHREVIAHERRVRG